MKKLNRKDTIAYINVMHKYHINMPPGVRVSELISADVDYFRGDKQTYKFIDESILEIHDTYLLVISGSSDNVYIIAFDNSLLPPPFVCLSNKKRLKICDS